MINIMIATLGGMACLALGACLWRSVRRRKRVPVESIRSMIAEGVIEIHFHRVHDNYCHIAVKSPIQLRCNRLRDCMLLSYRDGSSPTVIDDESLGLTSYK